MLWGLGGAVQVTGSAEGLSSKVSGLEKYRRGEPAVSPRAPWARGVLPDLIPSLLELCGGLAVSQGGVAQHIRLTLWAPPGLEHRAEVWEDTDMVLMPRQPA